MALNDTKTWDIVYQGLTLQIVATDLGNGLSSMTVNCLLGAADINALYWGDDVADGTIFSLSKALNMNGAGAADWDGGVALSQAGLGQTAVNGIVTETDSATKGTYLHAGESLTLGSVNVSWDDLDVMGVRATSTSTLEGSIKGVDSSAVIDVYEPPQPPAEYDGLSQGAWGTPLAGAGNWTQTDYHTSDSYETVFGVDAGGNVNGDTLLKVLTDPVQGDHEAQLGKQAVAALLNANSDGEATLTEPYRFTEGEIKEAVQKVYDGGFDAAMGDYLSDVLEFWNTAPEANVGVGATVPGELHENDTTLIATTLEFNGHDGLSFDGGLLAVLEAAHPEQDWIV